MEVAADDAGVVNLKMSRIDPEEKAAGSKLQPSEKLEEKKKVVKDDDKEVQPSVGCLTLFRFADNLDIFFMIVGSLMAAANGTGMPLMLLVFGDMTNSFIGDQLLKNLYQTFNISQLFSISESEFLANETARIHIFKMLNQNDGRLNQVIADASTNSILDQMTGYTVLYIALGVGVLAASYFQTTFWLLAAERQTKRIRRKFFWAVMRQEIGWFDTHETGELNTRLSDDLNKIHDGIGDKLGNFIQWFSGFIAGIVLGFVKGWKLTLVIMSVSPLMVFSAVLMNRITGLVTSQELKAYAKAGAIAEEVFANIRTVIAFGGQKKECDRYQENLKEARDLGTKKSFVAGISLGFVWFIIFAAYALAFWYGTQLVQDEPKTYNPGTLLTVFFAVIMAAFSLGSAFPNLSHVGVARGAAYTIYNIIDQKPKIDSSSDSGKVIQNLTGTVELRDVHFNYPSRADVKVLQGLDLRVERGQTAALVGSSGCGKSTVVSLLQRFYDTDSGQVMIDGRDVKELNVRWLRQHLGVVSQEPVLFATTIKENIEYGREDVTQLEVEQACRMANAYDFIMELPKKFDTIVGERGAQLSGGQKQRIAIARALVRNPCILLLDEATSALDTESEHVVQQALDQARQGRTTLVIAHRLSTIKNANVIFGFENGKVVEKGSHEELMQRGGIYQKLVENQTSAMDDEDEDGVNDEEEDTLDKAKEREELIELQRQLGSGTSKELKRQISRQLSESEEKSGRGLAHSVSHEQPSSSAQKQEEEAAGCCAALKAKKKKEEEEAPPVSMGRLMGMNASEWPFILLGCFGAIINGGINPAFAIIFAEVLAVFSETDSAETERKVNIYCIVFLSLGILTFITQFFQAYMFGRSGEALTMRLRHMCFKQALKQEMSYFDDPANSTGAITTRLATEASMVQGATGVRLGQMVMIVSNLGAAIIIAFYYSWELTLVILAFVPVMIVSGIIQMQVMAGSKTSDKSAFEEAGKISTESITNIRTVATLTKEQMFHQQYMDKLEAPYKRSLCKAHMQGFAYGFSNGVMFFAYAAAFQMGAYLIRQDKIEFVDVMKVFSAIVYGAMGVGNASAMAPDVSKAQLAAAKIFALLDRESKIDSMSEEGSKPAQSRGTVALQGVRFRYPTRADVSVLRSLSLSTEVGQTVALVGSSGCGKSTALQMIQRFYDPLKGDVMLDNQRLPDLNVGWLRRQLGIVSQEPSLFDASIQENIAYGDLSRNVPMEEIIQAARNANIHSFIQSLPEGYNTNVGDKGTQLSGGQKQRIAIARALIRDPKVLLLDEATSALDTESEKVVQEALDRAQAGRTCIVIAHRLSTIQTADVIFVIHNGQVAEKGNHSELMQKRGRYYMLQKKGRLQQ